METSLQSLILPALSYLGLVTAGVIWFLWSIMSGFRQRKQQSDTKLSEAQRELLQVREQEAHAWKQRYETEHLEYTEYRQKVHEKAAETTARLLELTSQCADLKAKTDLTPVLEHIRNQDAINTKVVDSLDALLTKLRGGSRA